MLDVRPDHKNVLKKAANSVVLEQEIKGFENGSGMRKWIVIVWGPVYHKGVPLLGVPENPIEERSDYVITRSGMEQHTKPPCPEKKRILASWWLNQPSWKNCSSNWIISPGIQVENKKYLSCHHMGVSKNRPQIIHLFIWFSIIFTIHFGGQIPYVWFNIHMCHGQKSLYWGWSSHLE